MKDAECVRFLQWALPRMRLRWRGLRKVRRQVGKRLGRRLAELGLSDLEAYRERLASDPGGEEWAVLDGLCRIPISRFYRDRAVFDHLFRDVLPALAQCHGEVACWSAGCASGEEPYTLAIAARLLDLPLRIVATDTDPHLLARAEAARYGPSSVKELPREWREQAFTAEHVLRPAYREAVRFEREDIRDAMPAGPFHLVLCRNLAFMYFAEELQREILARIAARLRPGGVLVIGQHETLPARDLAPWDASLASLGLYRSAGRA
ncbi:MAG: CheR family methyltransferase [Planctomycetota bacterium]|jgi:chemotaxis protein methyltransferase CheR